MHEKLTKIDVKGKVEGEMVLLSEGSSVKGSPEDKQASAPSIRGSAKISRRVTLALYTGVNTYFSATFTLSKDSCCDNDNPMGNEN